MTPLLFVDETAQVGGAELNLLLKARHLQAANWPLKVIVPQDGPFTQLLAEAAVPVHQVPRLPLISTSFYVAHRVKVPNLLALVVNFFLGLVWVWRLFRYFRQQRPAIVHTISMSAHVFAGTAARLAGCPLVWHFQDIVSAQSGFGLYRQMVRFLARYLPQRIICISTKVQEQFAGDKQVATKLYLLWNAIDVQKYSLPSGVPQAGQPLCIATVARLTHWKGQETALHAAHQLKQRGIPFCWHFVGNDALGGRGYQTRLQAITSQLGLDDEVKFLGWVADMPAFYQSIDLLVHLPLEPEPYGLVLAEAMAAGLPIVTTAGGGLEAVVREAGGYLVLPGDPTSVAQVLERLYAAPAKRFGLGHRARQTAVATFDPQRYTQELIAVYQSLEESPVHA